MVVSTPAPSEARCSYSIAVIRPSSERQRERHPLEAMFITGTGLLDYACVEYAWVLPTRVHEVELGGSKYTSELIKMFWWKTETSSLALICVKNLEMHPEGQAGAN